MTMSSDERRIFPSASTPGYALKVFPRRDGVAFAVAELGVVTDATIALSFPVARELAQSLLALTDTEPMIRGEA